MVRRTAKIADHWMQGPIAIIMPHCVGIAVSEAWYRNPTLFTDDWRSDVVLKNKGTVRNPLLIGLSCHLGAVP